MDAEKKKELDNALTKITRLEPADEDKSKSDKDTNEAPKSEPEVKEEPKQAPKKSKAETLTLDEKIVSIQYLLKVPKDRDNDYGGFKYRTAEDIESQLKVFEKNLKVMVRMENEEPICVGKFNYIKSNWIIKDLVSGEVKRFSAVAREDDTRKGMDAPQLSGSSSSYARKRALDGFFMLDNRQDDPDSNESYKKRRNTQQSSQGTRYNKQSKADKLQQAQNWPTTYKGLETTIGVMAGYLSNKRGPHYKDAKAWTNTLDAKSAKVLNYLLKNMK